VKKRTKVVIAGTAIAAAAAVPAVALAGGEGPDQPITGPALGQASSAALEFTGGGRVTGTEVGDEESYYEVEVTRDDGTRIDVQLDEDFTVVGSDPDEPGQDETGAD
jgi:hypothetical protein